MNTPSARRVRQVVQRQGEVLQSLAPALRQFQERLDGLEQAVRAPAQIATRGFIGRLRWLVAGR